MHLQLSMDHPTIWKFIDALRTVQKGRDKEYEEFVNGFPASQKRNKYIAADVRIKEIVEGGLEERIAIEYLRAISHNFSSD